jgi:hypothetical protein
MFASHVARGGLKSACLIRCPLRSPSAPAKPAENGWVQAYEMSPVAYAPFAPPPGYAAMGDAIDLKLFN